MNDCKLVSLKDRRKAQFAEATPSRKSSRSKKKKKKAASRTASIKSNSNAKNMRKKSGGYADVVVLLIVVAIILVGLGFVFGVSYFKAHAPVTPVTQVEPTEVPAGDTASALQPTTCQNGLCRTVISGACNTASTTAALLTNPYSSASSTASVLIFVSANATNTAITIGTTTKTRLQSLVATDVSPTLVNTTLATNTPGTLRSGVTVGIPTSGAGTFQRIGVGNGQNIGIFMTSGNGVPSTSYLASACRYFVEFEGKQF